MSLQTSILEKKTRQVEPKDRISTPPPEADTKPEGLHQQDPPCTDNQPDKEASTVDDQDVLRKDSTQGDTKSDDISPKTDVEKESDAGLDKLDKAEEGKGNEPKISASQASPGSSTISGKGRKNTVPYCYISATQNSEVLFCSCRRLTLISVYFAMMSTGFSWALDLLFERWSYR